MLFINFVIGSIDRKSTFIAATPAAILFLYQRYDPFSGNLNIPVSAFQSSSLITSLSFVTGSLIYMFLPLLPLIFIGIPRIKHIDIWAWTASCLFFIYMPIFLPQYSSLWYRWALLLAYPVYFFAIEGIEVLWKTGFRLNGKLKIGAIIAIVILLVNFTMTGFYVAYPPENQIKYFGDWNNYKAFIPTSMLQNSVPISVTPSVIEALKWIKTNLNYENTILVLHESIDNWAEIIIGNSIKIIRVNEVNISSPFRENVEETLLKICYEEYMEGKNVYTVWWNDGKGWYNMPSLPSQFVEIKSFGNIGIFKYQPSL